MTEHKENIEHAGNEELPPLRLTRPEADLLGVELETHRDGPRDGAYPHDLPDGGLTEDMVVELLVGDEDADSREDVDEAIADSMERAAEGDTD
jgi:hypothetical protein